VHDRNQVLVSGSQYSTGRFRWSCRDDGSVLHVSFEGELDLQAVPITQKALQQSLAGSPRTVVLDMSATSFIDSSGLGLLIRTKKEVEERDGRLVVTRLSPPVKRLIDLCRLNAWFDPAEDAVPSPTLCPICGGPTARADEVCERCRRGS